MNSYQMKYEGKERKKVTYIDRTIEVTLYKFVVQDSCPNPVVPRICRLNGSLKMVALDFHIEREIVRVVRDEYTRGDMKKLLVINLGNYPEITAHIDYRELSSRKCKGYPKELVAMWSNPKRHYAVSIVVNPNCSAHIVKYMCL